MIPGFHCDSLEFHSAARLIEPLAAMGFGAIAIRPRRGGWDLDSPWFEMASAEISAAAKAHHVAVVIDLDAPFYGSPDSIESYSIASGEASIRQMALDQIGRWIDQTRELCPAAITFSTGRAVPLGQNATQEESHGEAVLERLAEGIDLLCRRATAAGVPLALRPVWGHAIATVAHFERFDQWHGSTASLGLAADVGEMLLGGEFPIGARLARLGHRLTCVYLCEPDVERGCDQRFGRGDIDLARVWGVMTESGYSGPAIFRSCGHGRVGLPLAEEAMAVVRSAH